MSHYNKYIEIKPQLNQKYGYGYFNSSFYEYIYTRLFQNKNTKNGPLAKPCVTTGLEFFSLFRLMKVGGLTTVDVISNDQL